MYESEDSFFVTLMSNSSHVLYPNNIASRFTNKLPKRFEFSDEMEVALIEIHFPYMLNNMCNFNSMAWVERNNKLVSRCVFDDAYMGDVTDLLRKLETDFCEYYEFGTSVLRSIDEDRVYFKNIQEDKLILRLTKTLAMQLGIPTRTEFPEKEFSAPCRPNLNIGIPSHALVYCNIVKPQIVGDKLQQVLRSITINTNKYIHGAQGYMNFPHKQYVPLNVNLVDEIHIDIRDNTGYHLPFNGGTSSLILHFRRRS